MPTTLRGPFGQFGPEALVELAEQQIGAGQHEQARALLSTAWVYLQMQLVLRSDRRLESLQELAALPPDAAHGFTMFRLMSYYETADAMALARRIVGAYTAQQRHALSRGDNAGAQRLATLHEALQQRLRQNVVGGSVLTMEATGGSQRTRGPGYTVHGAQGGDEFVTPLPGTPRPDELGRHPAYTLSTEDLLTTLQGQDELHTEVLRHATVRQAFPTGQIDFSDEATRVRLWTALYRSFSASPAPGAPDALASTLRLLERYLRHFTVHTEYNIDDFGPSYVGRAFPRDLAGRALRDCGVYAVKVAAELQRTVRAVGRNVDFQLFFTLDHAMLAILDRTTQRHYLVSNDEIRGPLTGDPMQAAGVAYGRLMGQTEETAAIGAHTPVLSGRGRPQAFARDLWRQYQALAHLGLAAPPGTSKEDVYNAYYRAVEQYMRDATALQGFLDRLSSEVANAPAAQRAGLLGQRLPDGLTAGIRLQRILDTFRAPGVAGLTRQTGVPVSSVLFVTTSEQGTHPLIRLAKAVLLAQHLGATLDARGQQTVQFVQGWPSPGFPAALLAYRQAGHPTSF